MRRFYLVFALLFVLSSVLSLFACTPAAPRDPFAYAGSPFSLSVEGTYLPANDPSGTPRPFAAQITVGAPVVSGDPTLRNLTVTFTSPDTLAGVTVTATPSPATDGGYARAVTFSYPSDYGEVRFTATGEELDGLLRFAEALLPIGDVAERSPTAEDGSFTITRRTGAREAVFVFSEGTAFPVRVRLTDERGTVEMGVRASGG